MAPTDAWVYLARSDRLRGYGKYLGLVLLTGNRSIVEEMASLLALAERDFHAMLEMLLWRWNDRHLAEAERLVARMGEIESRTALRKHERALFLNLAGAVRGNAGDPAGALVLFRRSLDIYDHPENQARGLLRRAIMDAPANR